MVSKIILLMSIGFYFASAQQQPVPPFLFGASQETINSFHQLLPQLQGLPEADIDQSIAEWVSQQSPDIRSKYVMFRAEEKERARWRAAEQAEMASHLSPAAQVAERQFTAIEHNPRLTPQEKNQQTQQLKNSLPKNIVNEIEQMFQNQMRQHQEAREAFHAAAMAKLSPEAREADAKLAEIDRNPLIPPQQKVQYIQMFLNSLPKQVKDELDRALSG